MSKSDPTKPKRLAMIASKGTLDWAYVPFILASAAPPWAGRWASSSPSSA